MKLIKKFGPLMHVLAVFLLAGFVAACDVRTFDDAVAEFSRWKKANPAINLDHYIEYFKSYHATDPSVGAELSDALVKLKSYMAA